MNSDFDNYLPMLICRKTPYVDNKIKNFTTRIHRTLVNSNMRIALDEGPLSMLDIPRRHGTVLKTIPQEDPAAFPEVIAVYLTPAVLSTTLRLSTRELNC